LQKHGYNVLLIDGLRDRLENTEILDILKRENIKVAGITCLSAYYNEVVLLSRYLKENGIKVIVGGVHPTFMPYQTLLESKADYAICGEGEIAMLALAKNNFNYILHNGLGRIKGVYALSDLQDETTPFEKADIVEKLDDIPYPDWRQMNLNSYPLAPHGAFAKYFPIGIIFSSRGCPYSCKFCASPNFYDKKVRFRSAENIIGEIKYLIENFKVKEIQFEDDNITFKRDHIEKICNFIIDNKIKIALSCPNGIRAGRVDEDLIKLMKKAGFYYCAIGVESANKDILRNIDKKESIETIINSIKLIAKHGIVTQGFFIFGLPGETKETIEETINFTLNTDLERAQFLILDVLPGCDLWNDLDGEFVSNFSKKSYKEPE
jgi:magnesium-protoporphyrin IX monomethyl ester (oxidative) cyclase